MSKDIPFTSDDGVQTHTSTEQSKVERKVTQTFKARHDADSSLSLLRDEHVAYLLKAFDGLSQVDASKPWLCYWVVHALDLLDAFPFEHHKRIASYLARCQDPSGGFCGGPGQLPHLAPTYPCKKYAAINAIIICGGEDTSCYDVIDRKKLYSFLMRMKSPDGGFTMHEDGEVDVRGTYCALSVARMLNILTPELVAGAAEYVVRCQTYEGGIGGYPGNEAHGGYTFCGFAAMVLMDKINLLNMPLLLSWVSKRQMVVEGGFQGRTNKLVDACYSFWQGALFPLIQAHLHNSNVDITPMGSLDSGITGNEFLFDEKGLQRYILLACQDDQGGLRDKPGKGRDYYHTCYALSGLAVSQQHTDRNEQDSRMLKITHPVHNIRVERVSKVIQHFKDNTIS